MSGASAMAPDALARFYARMAEAHVQGQWQSEGVRKSGKGGVVVAPDGSFTPQVGGAGHLWRWEMMQELLHEACVAVPDSFTARRTLSLRNPELERGATHSIAMALQMIRPGELAWAHRHSLSALRFVLCGGAELYTVVDGRQCPMQDHDLILTPGWSWHDHRNGAGSAGVWLDVLDGPLLGALNQMFYEPFGDKQQPLADAGDASLRAAPDNVLMPRAPGSQTMRFAWADTEPQLRAARDAASAYDGTVLEYVQPDGAPALPSLGCWVQLLQPDEATRRHRHSSGAVYTVIRGHGCTLVEGKRLEWGPRDCFIVPNWSWHEHLNLSANEDAVLFSVNDIPLLRPLGLYREEPELSLWRPGDAMPRQTGTMRPPGPAAPRRSASPRLEHRMPAT